jgi:tRNA threonylcarbamoyl adenosine modification protein (Sua5/YciO/YrdC/YwlC family)
VSDTGEHDQRSAEAGDDTQPRTAEPLAPELVPGSDSGQPVAAEIEQAQAAIETAEETVPEPATPEADGPDELPASEPEADEPSDASASAPEVVAPPYQRFDCTRPDDGGAAEAARLAVERGELVVLPTDTVYGIGADAFSPEAVQRLLDAKVRGRDMPPPVLIADSSLIRALAVDIPPSAEALVERHWPGPLTVICKARSTLQMDLGETEGTVALRVPDHDLARDLLRRTGPLAVSSANISGMPAALSCDEAIDQLGGSVAVYLDGGVLGGPGAAPSTIVDFTNDDRGEVLRHGALSLADLRETLPEMVDLVEPEPEQETIPSEAVAEEDSGSDSSDGPVTTERPPAEH